MAKPEFDAGDRMSWNYGVGKGTGHVVERVTKTTKLYGRNFKATPEEPKYRVKSDKGKDVIRNPETLQMLKDEGKRWRMCKKAPARSRRMTRMSRSEGGRERC